MDEVIRGFILKSGQSHIRADNTVIDNGYLFQTSTVGDGKERSMVLKYELWKDKETFIAAMSGMSTATPVTSFSYTLTGDDFNFFRAVMADFIAKSGEFFSINNPRINTLSGGENIDWTKWELEPESEGIPFTSPGEG